MRSLKLIQHTCTFIIKFIPISTRFTISPVDVLDFLKAITQFLSQHSVPTALLVECPTLSAATLAAKQLESISRAPSISLSLFQPLNMIASFSAALGLLAVPSDQISVIELAVPAVSAVGASSLAPGCSVLKLDPHFPPQQLFSLSLLHIATTIKRSSGALCVGCVMKPSRQQALTKQGMLPFLPTDGVFFLPVDVNLPLPASLFDIIDLLLHKPTDFLERKPDAPLGAVPDYSSSLLSCIARFPPSCVIDPLPTLSPVLDRAQMAAILDTACTAARKLAMPVRTPAWHPVDKFSPEVLRAASSSSGVSTPCVVKPIVACGVEESHRMAFILHPSGLQSDLDVPLPAILQEYIDHSSTLWKVYVAGNQVYTVQKRSTPDLQPLKASLRAEFGSLGLFEGGSLGVYSNDGGRDREERENIINLNKDSTFGDNEDEIGSEIPTSIEFDSLHSLPVSLPWLRDIEPQQRSYPLGSQRGGIDPGNDVKKEPYPYPLPEQSWAAVMRPEFLKKLADVLRQQLGLTLFGFDVVFDHAAGEAVILDLNFFPSFKGIEEAPKALRTALLQRWKKHQEAIAHTKT